MDKHAQEREYRKGAVLVDGEEIGFKLRCLENIKMEMSRKLRDNTL